jgi:hypothetical protein
MPDRFPVVHTAIFDKVAPETGNGKITIVNKSVLFPVTYSAERNRSNA